jgi:hypothetical protein
MNDSSVSTLLIDPTPRFELSPFLSMQFMEPLGVTDSSVAAAWDDLEDRWRADVVDVTRLLAPTMLRWGGIFASYYRWREGIGPAARRPPMLNLEWGGWETNRVGTHEFVDFCRLVGAEPLLCVNFEGEGRAFAVHPRRGPTRAAGPEEAAEWVAYCNDPGCAERRENGSPEPLGVRMWQLGNETSYGPDTMGLDRAVSLTISFAKAMRARDPSIQLIGWGDSRWARPMLERAGEYLDSIAFHHHFQSGLPDSPLEGTRYRDDPERTWAHLMHAYTSMEAKLSALREETRGYPVRLAMTEGHFALQGRNRCEVLSSWAAGVASARVYHVQERNGDILKIATLADFCGTRWQVNALMIPVPGGRPFLMPVARVMSLYRHHVGTHAVNVVSCPEGLDVTASRSGDRLFLHVANILRTRPVTATLKVDDRRPPGVHLAGRVFTLAADPEVEIYRDEPGLLEPRSEELPRGMRWTFPAASVSAIELDMSVHEPGAKGATP